MILAGDIGGTNTRLALFQVRGGRLVMGRRTEAKNAQHRSFTEIVRAFLRASDSAVRIACFGVAGPVLDGRAQLTNRSWVFDERHLARQLPLERVVLINDLVAHAEGTNLLDTRDLVTLQRGKPHPRATRAILAPGTGLGEGGLVHDHRTGDYRAVASEGGHCDFSPTDPREDAFLQFVRARNHGRCSWEDVLSGPGLKLMWQFLTSRGRFRVAGSLAKRNPAPADITAAAEAGSCNACAAAVEMFVSLCGAETGNLALKFLATGGVYIGGGIPPKIQRFLKRPAFRAAFCRKGPRNVNALLRSIPIQLIKSDDTALLGAALHATRV